MVPAVHSSSVEEDGRIVYLGVATGYVDHVRGRADDLLRRRHRRLRRHAADRRDVPAVDRVPADRRSLHDGPGAGGEGVRAARRQAGRADALRHVPGADRHAGEAARAGRAARRAGAGAEARRDAS